MFDQRKFKRVAVHSRGRAESINGRHFGIIARDITPEGLGLITDYSLQIGDILRVCINLEDRKVCCKAKIVWVKQSYSCHHKPRYLCGAKIINVPQDYWPELIGYYSRQIMRQFSQSFRPFYSS